jgi:predicted flap endonuclease-1-like 5' DNA nuclease
MLRARVEDLEPLSARIASHEAEIGGLRAQIDDLNSKLRDAEARLSRIHDLEVMFTRAVNPPPEEEWDDLIAINGVGPVLAEMLHRLGIYTFKQVAMWNDEQVDWVDAQLEHFHGRIRRENWIDSAKDEHFKKYGERL